MTITLGSLAFEEPHTTVLEKHEEVGGRNQRVITLSGVITGESTVTAIESKLDGILDEASVEDFSVELSLRPGRRLFVRRNKFERDVSRDSLVGTFTLELGAKSPFEESTSETAVNWPVTASGATKAATAGGTVYSIPTITLVASGSIVNPSFSDGTRTISYSGTVADGETLVFDAAARLALLDGADVTPYTAGLFPRILPEGTTLTYTDDAASSHTATVTISFRDRWW